MSDNLISSSGLKLRISDELAKRSELNNLAKSSVVSQIIDSVVEPMADNINTTTMAINSVYTDLAAGAYLTANAYDFGVIRNIYSNVYLSDDDQVVSLSMNPRNSRSRFPLSAQAACNFSSRSMAF